MKARISVIQLKSVLGDRWGNSVHGMLKKKVSTPTMKKVGDNYRYQAHYKIETILYWIANTEINGGAMAIWQMNKEEIVEMLEEFEDGFHRLPSC